MSGLTKKPHLPEVKFTLLQVQQKKKSHIYQTEVRSTGLTKKAHLSEVKLTGLTKKSHLPD